MIRKLITLAALAILAAPFATARAQAQEAQWIHVRIDQESEATARLNLPASMVTVALEMVRREGLEGIRLDDRTNGDVKIEDLRRMWEAMRDAGDAEFVNVRDGDAHVRVFRVDERLHVQADGEDGETVRVVMPVEIADIVLGSGDDEIDVEAVVRELARRGDPELVQISGPDGTVRVWVDDRSTQD